MGFKSVYQCLMDVFPQVDSRILKAVAIEHSKDADAAVEIVLSEILPYLQTRSVVCNPHRVDKGDNEKLIGAEDEEETVMLRHRRSSSVKAIESSSEPRYTVEEGSSKNVLTVVGHGDSSHQKEALNPPAINNLCDVSIDDNRLPGNIENDELILLGEPQIQEFISQLELPQAFEVFPNALVHGIDTDLNDTHGNVTEMPVSMSNSDIKVRVDHSFLVTSGSLLQEKCDLDSGLTAHNSEWEYFDTPLPSDIDVVVRGKGHQEESHVHDYIMDMENSVITQTSDNEACLSSERIHNMINACGNLKFDQDSRIALLEDMVEAAKNNKTTLFSAMESVMNMMREVEAKEDEAEVVKEEAARGGLDILAQVEELKKILAHAKEANNLHAGEVYGEQAILATEVKELQARLFSLSDERDNALAILDEMHQAFKERLVVAEELRKAAELEKLGKEESARNALIEQEAIMEKVVQESKILQQEAEENSKLREFLMDRGRLVDTLQGEISVICQDVRLLKEKFDERVPLCKSISSGQTSCFLASSGSSIKSTLYDLDSDLGDKSWSSKEVSSASKSPKKKLEAEERVINCDAQPLDDGWEFCESPSI